MNMRNEIKEYLQELSRKAELDKKKLSEGLAIKKPASQLEREIKKQRKSTKNISGKNSLQHSPISDHDKAVRRYKQIKASSEF